MPGDACLYLKPGRDKSLLRRHPWVFSGGIDRVTGSPGPGETVVVRAASGQFLGRAAFSPSSQIRARVWTFDEGESVDGSFFLRRVQAAASARGSLTATTNAVRLVFAENDGLPGVVADCYGAVVVVQLTSAGADHWRDTLADAFASLPGVQAVFERSDGDGRKKEGLAKTAGLLRGTLPGAPAEVFEARPGGERSVFQLDIDHGHKTGFYLDQRDARPVVAGLAMGRSVLDVCAYSGGFSVAAFSGGATAVTTIDSSAPALRLAALNLQRNGFPADGIVLADAFADLRLRRDRAEKFGLIVLDPPKLAATERDVARAARAYKDLNLLAFKLLEAGGYLVTFSCSGAVDEALFGKIVAGAALDARRDVHVVGRLGQPSDHPTLLSFPEGRYLKGLICRAA